MAGQHRIIAAVTLLGGWRNDIGQDMKRWVKAYVTGSTNSRSTQKERLDCMPTGKEGLQFGLGVGCTGGWYGYTGGIPEYTQPRTICPVKTPRLSSLSTASGRHLSPGSPMSFSEIRRGSAFPPMSHTPV